MEPKIMKNEEIHAELISLTAQFAEASLHKLDDASLMSLTSQWRVVGGLLEALGGATTAG
jgi:hypothetical protein